MKPFAAITQIERNWTVLGPRFQVLRLDSFKTFLWWIRILKNMPNIRHIKATSREDDNMEFILIITKSNQTPNTTKFLTNWMKGTSSRRSENNEEIEAITSRW